MPSTSKHGTSRGLPIKEVLEYLLPELDLSCLRLALNTPKVTEQLMKLDEQGVNALMLFVSFGNITKPVLAVFHFGEVVFRKFPARRSALFMGNLVGFFLSPPLSLPS